VRVTKADFDRLSKGRSPEELLEESFRFSLECESNTSILGSFDLLSLGTISLNASGKFARIFANPSYSSANPALDLPGVSEIGLDYFVSFLSRFHEDTVTGSSWPGSNPWIS